MAVQSLPLAGLARFLPLLFQLLTHLAHAVFKVRLFEAPNRVDAQTSNVACDRKYTDKRNCHIGEEPLVVH